MGFWGSVGRGAVWAFARNTEVGKRLLGKETLLQQHVREQEQTRRRLEGRWFNKYIERDGTIELLIDRDGNPTDRYPHVHVIHDEKLFEVRILVSVSPHNHASRQTLPGSASGNEVNAAIDRALAELRRY
jgi:hypothetical protein